MDKSSIDYLFSVTYEELRRLAAKVKSSGGPKTLNPTALVNEVYLHLVESLKIVPESRLHFKRIAARAMRQVLVEAARRKSAVKRGAGQPFVAFDEALDCPVTKAEDLMALDEALLNLEHMNPRQAELVTYRFFGGYELAEISTMMGVSESTLARDWRAVKAWLATQLYQN